MDVAATHGRLGPEASAFLSGPHRLLIGGEWVEAKSGKIFDVFDPATGQMVAEGDAADIEARSPPRAAPSRKAPGRA